MDHVPIAISDIIRNGVIFDFKNWSQKMNGDDLIAADLQARFSRFGQ